MKRSLIIYLGRRGGGVELVKNLSAEIAQLSSRFDWLISSKIQDFDCGIFIDSNQSYMSLDYKDIFRSSSRILKKYRLDNYQSVFFLMPSVFDYRFYKILHKQHSAIVTLIHDFRRHKGELWPTQRALRFRLRLASEVITFSRFVANNLVPKHPQITVSTLGSKRIHAPRVRKADHPLKVVLIGRGKSYQGRNLFISAFKLMPKNMSVEFEIVGGKSVFASKEAASNLRQHVGWLSRSEYEDYLQSASLIVLPYIEASQSGIIPEAHNLGIPTIVTNIGGLPEQVKQGINGLICEPSARSLAESILEGLNKSWSINEKKYLDSLALTFIAFDKKYCR